MHTCSRGPMIGRRMGWGDHDRTHHRKAKLVDQRQLAIDIADDLAPETIEAITAHAITPRMYEDAAVEWDAIDAEDATDRWFDWWDDEDRDPFPFDDVYPLSMLAAVECGDIDAEDAGFVDISTINDTGPLPGWGTHLDIGDLAGFTITNRAYGYSYGRQED